ncbi:SIR2 family protein [Erysipelothrix rhusiopathiae]|uniref:SIR2 family protein n=1 Tax=Erysipelothrix rhusiopathiae TaxID=1648 RepID=UPI001EDE3940|nr:SIR2 family protein [Erysipelothrix rhusiopathiae]MCG4456506.1 SIR2 family protein [Erysipelothrix rhusiopathiae]MDE8303170.1 SIR2 family protein [Erysipelothrix rhusiopathiae]
MEELKKILIDAKALPYLFIGSGISRRYINTPDWLNLLEQSCIRINQPLARFINSAQREASSKGINDQNYLLSITASKIAEVYDDYWFTSNDEWFVKRRKIEKNRIESGKYFSPLKIDIAHDLICLTDEFIVENNELESEIYKLHKITSKSIGGIVTTNYDQLLENHLFPSFSPIVGKENLLTSELIGIDQIYKIHGCVSSPNKMVLNYEDYEDYLKKEPYLAAKLLTIFVEHPVIFMGYSLTDPNVVNLLKMITDCLNSEQLKLLSNRLILIEWDSALTNTEYSIETHHLHGIQLIKIALSNYELVYDVLYENRASFSPTLFKRLRHSIYEAVTKNEPSQVILVDSNATDFEIESKPIIIGFTKNEENKSEQLAEFGRVGVNSTQIYEDLLFDSHKLLELTPKDLVSTIYNASFPVAYSVPLLKYRDKMEPEMNYPLYEKLVVEMNTRGQYSPNIPMQFSNLKDSNSTIIISTEDISISNKLKLLVYRTKIGDSEELQHIIEFAKLNFEEIRGAYRTEFRHLCKMIDWALYKKNR